MLRAKGDLSDKCGPPPLESYEGTSSQLSTERSDGSHWLSSVGGRHLLWRIARSFQITVGVKEPCSVPVFLEPLWNVSPANCAAVGRSLKRGKPN